MSDPLYDDLNEAQAQAVAHGHGPLMVLAGAGSGKTRVVTRRIARLLRDGVRPGQILAMTFTNKAAGEMARRVEELGGGYVRVATFHSACARFLRQDGHQLGFPADFSIYDTQDRDALIKELMDDLGLASAAVKPSLVGQWLSKLKNAALRPGDGMLDGSDVGRIVERLWTPYHERMRKVGAMDFDDLMGNFLQVLREFPEVAERYRARFPWLLVDEFQDTNRVQYDLLRLLCPPPEQAGPGNLCVVGDPDQSIYRFRGAEVRNILDFERDYPTTTVVRLEQNYRSTANILRGAEHVIANNKLRKDKRLRTDAPPGAKLLRLRAGGAPEEAATIVDRILELRDEGATLDQIALFYRAHWLSRGFEQKLKDHGVPYEIVGGLTFFERREIKDLLAYLRVLVNPLDDVSMARVVNVPPRGLGKAGAERLRQLAFEHGMSLREAVGETSLHGEFGPKAKKGLAELARVLDLAGKAAAGGASGALRVVLEGTKYVQHATSFGDAEDSTREENIAELVSDTVQFDAGTGRPSGAAGDDEPDAVADGLAGYLQHVALLTSADTAGDGPAVRMMTVHAAKGLEFDHVFVAGLEEGTFPSQRSAEDPEGLEEERRLMYVAMTRARRTLFLSSAKERMVNGQFQQTRPSRFLREIPEPVLENYAPSWRRYDADDDGAQSSGWSVTPDPEALAALRAGARVRHDLYGCGVVRRIVGRGMNARAAVRFDDGVEREFVLEYAGLKLLEDIQF
ncbi:MAG: UvrD-helicase domain-containing protein [Planctomycetes bacterium]|nr:UvrD-helicase domain-containing protein [Planctomycetota bacterium]